MLVLHLVLLRAGGCSYSVVPRRVCILSLVIYFPRTNRYQLFLQILSPPKFVNAMLIHGEGGVWHLLFTPALFKHE